jgi:hypothetical protein
MSVGYPDYARLSRDGGYLLYDGVNVTPPYSTALFKGYVGSFPYITLTLSCNFGTDAASINIQYYSDATFATAVGRRIINRIGTQFSVTQYVNLSEWAIVYYTTFSGNPVNFIWFTVYGSSGPANQIQLVSTDVPIYQFDNTIAATTVVSTTPQHVQPGRGILSVYTNATSWFVILLYYDIGSGNYLRLLQVDQTIAAKGVQYDVGMLDAPLQISIDNRDASAETFRVSLVSVP